MKVYVLTVGDFKDSEWIVGIFDSKEKAQSVYDQIVKPRMNLGLNYETDKEFLDWVNSLTYNHLEGVEIKEYELNNFTDNENRIYKYQDLVNAKIIV